MTIFVAALGAEPARGGAGLGGAWIVIVITAAVTAFERFAGHRPPTAAYGY